MPNADLCVYCRLQPVAPRWQPFCSERCKNIDFGAWASESFRVPDESPPDDLPFGDPKEQ